jgi:hypothetical protein
VRSEPVESLGGMESDLRDWVLIFVIPLALASGQSWQALHDMGIEMHHKIIKVYN